MVSELIHNPKVTDIGKRTYCPCGHQQVTNRQHYHMAAEATAMLRHNLETYSYELH
jgi:hypothetical protein